MIRVAALPAPAPAPAQEPECHRLFFALLPPPAQLAEIARIRDAAPAAGRPMRDDRLHVTLLMVDDLPFLPPMFADAMRAVGDRLEAEPLEIMLDRLVRARHRSVLVPGAPQPALRAFQQRLSALMIGAGIPVRRGWRFSPHVTLDFGTREPVDRTITPICWRATEFVLLDSWVGLTHHQRLGRWPLGDQRRLL